MLNLYFRAAALLAAEKAAESCPALTLHRVHRSLVMFRREHRNEEHHSVILFDRWAELEKLAVELYTVPDYRDGAIDLFRDEFNIGELKAILSRSEYALKEPIGMGDNSYVIKGRIDKLNMAKLAKDFIERQDEERDLDESLDSSNRDASAFRSVLGVSLAMIARLIKAGFTGPQFLKGITVEKLMTTGEFSLDDSTEIVQKATDAGLV